MRFRAWFESNRFLTEIFGRFNYQFPDNKSQQMADFYVLTMLLGRSSFDLARDKNLAKGDNIASYGKAFSPTPEQFSEEDKIDHLLQEVAGILIPKLKKQLLKEVMFSIVAELRHVMDINDPYKMLDITREKMGPEYAEILRKFCGNITKLSDDKMKPFLNPKRKKDTRETGEYSGEAYVQAYQAALRTEAAPEHLANLAKFLFGNPKIHWRHAFGGEAWADISDAWMQLHRAHNLKDIIVYIDHVYDIQHNSGSVLDKHASYRDENNRYEWIQQLLDKKASMNNPLELYSKVSPAMKPLLARATKLKFGKTLEDEGLLKVNPQGQYTITPQIIKEYMDFHDVCNHVASNFKASVAASILKIKGTYPNIDAAALIKAVFPSYPYEMSKVLDYYNALVALNEQMFNENFNGSIELTAKELEAIQKGQLQQLYYKVDLNFAINHFNKHAINDMLSNMSTNAFLGVQNIIEQGTGFPLISAKNLGRAIHIWAHCQGLCKCTQRNFHTSPSNPYKPMSVMLKTTGMGQKFNDPYEYGINN